MTPMPCIALEGREHARVTRTSRFGVPSVRVWYNYGFAQSTLWEFHR